MYKAEYDDCASIRARFNQYFIFGEMLDCNQWKTDYANCYEWQKNKSKKAYVCAISIILTIALIYHKIMFWKIAGWADCEWEAAQKRAFSRTLSEWCLGEKGEATRELERSFTWMDAEGIREFISTYKKWRDETGQGNFPAWFEMHYIVTISSLIWS